MNDETRRLFQEFAERVTDATVFIAHKGLVDEFCNWREDQLNAEKRRLCGIPLVIPVAPEIEQKMSAEWSEPLQFRIVGGEFVFRHPEDEEFDPSVIAEEDLLP